MYTCVCKRERERERERGRERERERLCEFMRMHAMIEAEKHANPLVASKVTRARLHTNVDACSMVGTKQVLGVA
jgi:hypothetical protein